jgi:hypothetical protein
VSNSFDDERLQFFLRHRGEIRDWAAIERDVVTATRDLLGGILPDLDERLSTIDPGAGAIRRDGGRYERILVRRQDWPVDIGMTLEWQDAVDPFGGSLPKYGIFFINGEARLEPARVRIVELARATPALTGGGFRTPGDRYWPAVRWVPKSADWWHDPTAWVSSITEALVDLWPTAAAIIDRGLVESPSGMAAS